MSSHTLAELELLCQKPDHRHIGNWMARRVARPLALRVTRVMIPLGVSAHAMTLFSWAMGLAAACGFGFGSTLGWLAGAGLLQLWYLLDHVDGQLARYHRQESLDGAALDYLMHHTINLAVPIGLGWGAFTQTGQPGWMLCGVACGALLLLIGLTHDARFKAIFKRLKRLEGELHVVGGGGGRPAPQPAAPRNPLRFAVWTIRKACEIHVVMNTLTLLTAVQLACGEASLPLGRWYLLGLTTSALLVAAAGIARGLRQEATEQEFAAWFTPPPGCTLEFADGWWRVMDGGEEGGHEPARESALRAK